MVQMNPQLEENIAKLWILKHMEYENVDEQDPDAWSSDGPTWRRDFSDAGRMDEDYLEDALRDYEDLHRMLKNKAGYSLKGRLQYARMCDLAIETCRKYLASDRSESLDYLLLQLQAIEGGLAVMFDLLETRKERDHELMGVRFQQARLYFGEYLAEIFEDYCKRASWSKGPLKHMRCTEVHQKLTAEKSLKVNWQKEKDELKTKGEHFHFPRRPETPIIDFLEQFCREENILYKEVTQNIEMYSDRNEIAHGKSRVRELVKAGSWWELTHQIYEDKFALPDRKLFILEESAFVRLLNSFQNLYYRDIKLGSYRENYGGGNGMDDDWYIHSIKPRAEESTKTQKAVKKRVQEILSEFVPPPSAIGAVKSMEDQDVQKEESEGFPLFSGYREATHAPVSESGGFQLQSESSEETVIENDTCPDWLQCPA